MQDGAQSVLESLEGTAYVVDDQWRLRAIGGKNWRHFAMEGGAPELAESDALLGRSLLDFIQGESVRKAWSEMLNVVAQGQLDVASVAYRCDSPKIKRVLRMAVTSLSSKHNEPLFLFHSVPQNETMRPPIPLFDYTGAKRPPQAPPRPLLAMCSFCHSVRQDEQSPWQTPEAYYGSGGSSDVDLTHSVCPNCHSRWLQDLGLAS